MRRRQTYTIGPHTYVYRQDIVWRRDIVMIDKNARNRLWCALRTTQGHSRTFTHETVDLHLIHGFVKEEVLLHDTAFTYNCTCIACDRIGANQPYFSSHSSPFLVKRHTRSKGIFVLYVVRILECHTNSLLKQNSKADTFQIVQTISLIKKIRRVVWTLILTFT